MAPQTKLRKIKRASADFAVPTTRCTALCMEITCLVKFGTGHIDVLILGGIGGDDGECWYTDRLWGKEALIIRKIGRCLLANGI